jgi:RNA polymerase sigma-70 factor (ECF subfamily)
MQGTTIAARDRSPRPGLEGALLACSKGDRAALRTIYEQEAAQMLGVARRMLRRPAAAEDVVHDAFVKIWQNAQSFDPARGSAKAWIYTILRHIALNALRRDGRTELVDDFERFDLLSPDDNPEAIVLRLSETSRLRRCLEGIEPQRRHALVLAYTHGLTHGEIAGRFGVPLGTMKSWIRRTLMALKDCMA